MDEKQRDKSKVWKEKKIMKKYKNKEAIKLKINNRDPKDNSPIICQHVMKHKSTRENREQDGRGNLIADDSSKN